MKHLLTLLTLTLITLPLKSQDQCSLQSFAYEVIPHGEEFIFSIHEPTPDVLGEQYKVTINNEVFPANMVEYGPFKADCETNYTLQLQHVELDFCSITANVGPVCPNGEECFISNIEYSFPECDSSGAVMIELDFDYGNVSDSFLMNGNGTHYGEFSYADLPVEIGPFESNCNTKYEFVVSDSEMEGCRNFTDDIFICCPSNCDRPEFEIVSQNCEDGILEMKLRILKDSFFSNITVQINEQYVSEFQIDGPYLYLRSELPLNAVLSTVTVCSVGIADVCCASQTFFTDGCKPIDRCIYNIEYWTEDCEEGDEVFVGLDFQYSEMVSDSFAVRGNGIDYGLFSYEDLPVKVGPFQSACDVLYELEITDFQSDSCFAAIEDLYICCHQGCLEPIFEIVDLTCSENQLKLKLELIHPLLSNALRITLNGDDSLHYEVNFPFVYIQYPIFNDDQEYELEICTPTSDGVTCCYAQRFSLEDCDNGEECRIGSLRVDPYDCIDTGIPGFIIDFQYANVGDEGFSVKGNGRDYGDFKYEELPIFIGTEENCDLFYEFVVIDNQFSCSSSVEFGQYCCNNLCSFRIREERVKCEDGLITEVAFYLEEDTDPIKSYEIFVNGEFIAETNENNVFLEFETQLPINDSLDVTLTICDSNCCVDYKLDVGDCIDPPQFCSIDNVELSQLSCAGSGIQFVLDFDHQGTNSERFEVFSLLGSVGTFAYDDLPVKVEGFPRLNFGLNALFICDQGSFCCQAHLFGTPQCLVKDGNDVADVIEQEKSTHRYLVQNPSNAMVSLRSPLTVNNYKIFDSGGKEMINQVSDSRETLIDSGNLQPGLYIVRIENELGIKIEKLIIAK